MPGISGRAAGFIATLYYVDTPIATKNITTVAAAAIEANQVIDTSDMGALTKERNVIDIPVYGQDVAGSLPGQASPGTFDFSVTMNMDDATHTAIRDDAGIQLHTYIIKFTQGANATYAVFDGYVATASVGLPIDGAVAMEVSIARDGGVTWLDAA